VFGAFFNAGVRVYDTSNPYQPTGVAHCVPEVPPKARANSAVDRLKGGLYILALTI
jgi:hypothetical protein